MKNDFASEINKRIAYYRKKAGFTQEKAAAKLGIKRNTYARMERLGNPKPEMLKNIAMLYNVNINEILNGKTDIEKSEKEPVAVSEITVNRFFDSSSTSFNIFPFAPTATEVSLLKTFHILSKDHQKSTLDYINYLRNEEKKK